MAIYAVDFDGTLAVTRFPEIVEPKRKIVAAVKMLKANGHKVILWTSRAGRDLGERQGLNKGKAKPGCKVGNQNNRVGT